MSQENVEVVRRCFEAAAGGDLGIWFQMADADIRVRPRPAEPDAADEDRGLDGLMDYVVNWYSQWDEYESEPVDIIDAGEHVLVVVRERGRVESTGMEIEEEFSHSFVIRDCKVAEWRMYDARPNPRLRRHAAWARACLELDCAFARAVRGDRDRVDPSGKGGAMSQRSPAIIDALRSIYDPCCREKGISVVDMGLVRSATLECGAARVELVLTSGWCPFSIDLVGAVRERVESLPEVAEASVEVVWDEVWSSERLAPSARAKLRFLPEPGKLPDRDAYLEDRGAKAGHKQGGSRR